MRLHTLRAWPTAPHEESWPKKLGIKSLDSCSVLQVKWSDWRYSRNDIRCRPTFQSIFAKNKTTKQKHFVKGNLYVSFSSNLEDSDLATLIHFPHSSHSFLYTPITTNRTLLTFSIIYWYAHILHKILHCLSVRIYPSLLSHTWPISCV